MRQDELERRLGPPRSVGSGGAPHFYGFAPIGQEVYAVFFDASRRVRKVEQRLTSAWIARIRAGVTSEREVADLLGLPCRDEASLFATRPVWDYPCRIDHHNRLLRISFNAGRVVTDVRYRPDRSYQGIPFAEWSRLRKEDNQDAKGR